MFQAKDGKQATRHRPRRTESHRGRQLRAKLTTAMDREREVRRKWKAVGGELDERARRLWAGAEARALGAGAVSLVSRATGLNRRTVRKGMIELGGSGPGAGRVRRVGGGRKAHPATQPDMVSALDSLVEPTTRGHPMSPLRWTIKSTRILAAELQDREFAVSHSTVGRMLREMGYSVQSTRKTREGTDHPDRDEQFRRISKLAANYEKRGQPVVSVDTKKKGSPDVIVDDRIEGAV